MKTLLTVLVVCFALCAGFPGGVEEPDVAIVDELVPEEISKHESAAEKVQEDLLEEFVEELGVGGLRVAPVEPIEPLEIPSEKVSYTGSQLWRVSVDTKDKKKVIGKLRDTRDLAMWGGNVTAYDILVRAKSKEIVKKSLDKNQINYKIVIEDVQQAIDDENPQPDEDDELVNRRGHRLTWEAYHRMDDIYNYLDYLTQTYSSRVTVQYIGTSVQGRQLKVVKISNGKPNNKAIWVDGGMHAREWISPATVTYIMDQLVHNGPPADLQNIDWYFLPVANPDGYEYSHTTDRLWRKNRARSGYCAGTDLNRNFGYKWGGKGSGKNPCQEIYAGTGPFSEPETAAIRNFITNSGANWKASVSFHSYGQYIIFPWGYDRVITPDHADLLSVAQRAANAIVAAGGPAYTIGPAGSTLYPAAGGSDDWAKGSAGIKYAYTIELKDTGSYGFLLPSRFIKPTATEAFAALRVIAQAASKA